MIMTFPLLLLFFLPALSAKLPTDPSQKSTLPLVNNAAVFNETAWSTYRPHLYFGLKNRRPDSPLFGLMWYRQGEAQPRLRHWAMHEDGVVFMWNQHDGRTFGSQKISDDNFGLRTDWLNFGTSSWVARLYLHNGQANESWPEGQAVLLYLALQDQKSSLQLSANLEGIPFMRGRSDAVGGHFKLRVRPFASDSTGWSISTVALKEQPFMDMARANNFVLSALSQQPDGNFSLTQKSEKQPNFVAIQVSLKENAALELLFQSEADTGLKPADFDEEFRLREEAFRAQFNASFAIPTDLPALYHKMGHSALSNLLGGIGVWHGNCLMHSRKFQSPDVVKPYKALSLLSAVPSRTNFSRGFVWDEGFHNLLIYKWNPVLSLDIIGAYLDLMNVDGWIPREVVLGSEAEARIPARFLVQADWVANPPMFFYWMREFISHSELLKEFGPRLRRMYPRMKQLYLWFKKSQRGPQPGTFQWHDRNGTSNLQLNPSTLASGFDDFPRASHPTAREYHLDLRCWMAMSSSVLAQLAALVGDRPFLGAIQKEAKQLNDPDILDRLHWSEQAQQFCDYGLHSEKVEMVPEGGVLVRRVMAPPHYQFVSNVNGYANLFPLLLQLLPADSPRLAPLLRQMADRRHFWTPYGLRSLSTLSPYYNAWNSEEDGPYWRGPIWINMNYFAIAALRHYSLMEGPHRHLCARMHDELRANLLRNVATEYERTGFLWENYNDQTGSGQGNHPFTGWTAVIVRILSDSY